MWKQVPACFLAGVIPLTGIGTTLRPATDFHRAIRPILETYCFDCHGDGARKGNVAFDEFKSDQAVLADRQLWLKALGMLRAGLMPPARKPRPSVAQREQIARWIKYGVFGIDSRNPDPGRVTLRRLNRVEYHNTIRDLLGVDYDTQGEFPPDDTGFGFDNIGDVLTLPPMLLEKYLGAAAQIISQAVAVEAGAGADYKRFFPRAIPADAEGRREYARQVLGKFAGRAFRRPVDQTTLERLVGLAEQSYTEGGEGFESGISHAMVAVLTSPRFLFREEFAQPLAGKGRFPFIDEYSLASRLSYFLWSSMPDDELLGLAGQGKLRKNLSVQVGRMLRDRRADALVNNFTGQWLRGRDIESIPIEERFVLAREEKRSSEFESARKRFRQLRDKPEAELTPAEREELTKFRAEFRQRLDRPARVELNGALRRAMRRETEKVFGYVLQGDRSLLDLLDSDYTFLNERLAKLYGITNVFGNELRLVELAPDSPRGGVITEGTVLVATSNPTRTSPVKRGAFILDSILGMPVPPPPPNLPPLEDAAKNLTNHAPSLRETLAMHRENPMCSSCHNSMDPLGLAFENFNALGMWRTTEFSQMIDPKGRLLAGEEFSNPKELKRILVTNHSREFYRTLTEKLLVYALGRGLEYSDVETVDQIVARIEKSGGRSFALLYGIIESAPFQKTRTPPMLTATAVRAETSDKHL